MVCKKIHILNSIAIIHAETTETYYQHFHVNPLFLSSCRCTELILKLPSNSSSLILSFVLRTHVLTAAVTIGQVYRNQESQQS